MYADVKRCIDTAARHSGFILSTSCEIPPKSDPEIVKWFMDAAHDYGRLRPDLLNGGPDMAPYPPRSSRPGHPWRASMTDDRDR